MKRHTTGSMGPWRQRIAHRLTWGVVLLQLAVLLTLWVTPTRPPPRIRFIELLWAWMHRPTFYPFVVLLVVGPVFTLLALCCQGRHRYWLLWSWLLFLGVVMTYHGDRVKTMLRTLHWVWFG